MKYLCTAGIFWMVVSIALADDGSHAIGTAEVDITPPNGFPVAGYYHERLATGTRDPLKARAVVFRGNGEQAAFVACDLAGIARDLTMEVRRRASTSTGIPADHIVLTATHSHTSPDYTRDLYEFLAEKPAKSESTRYAGKLIDGIVKAIEQAHARLKPAVVEAGSVEQKTPVSFNRRFVTKDGSVRTWMSLGHPDVVRAAGPIDPEIGLLLARSSDGNRPLALLSNFALHLDTVGGTLWSADYPFYMEEGARQALGKDLVFAFGLGCCGDINHVDPGRRERNKTDFIGRALAATVEPALAKLRRIDQPTLRVRKATVPLPLQLVTSEAVARARPLLLEAKAGKTVDFYDQVAAYKTIVLDRLHNKVPTGTSTDLINWGLTHDWAGIGTHLPVEVHVIALGRDVAIVTLPGEVFVDLGLAIKRASPFRTTMVVELANCKETMYIPTRAAYAGGSYEVTNSTTQPGSGEMLVEAAIKLLREAAAKPAAPGRGS